MVVVVVVVVVVGRSSSVSWRGLVVVVMARGETDGGAWEETADRIGKQPTSGVVVAVR